MINYASGEAVGRIWRAGQGVGGDASTTGNLILEIMGESNQRVVDGYTSGVK